MTRGVNKVILIGHLGRDPEIRTLESGTMVANISIATAIARKNPDTGKWEDISEWHSVVAFGKTAEIMGNFLRKGSKIYTEGRLKTDKWTDKSGVIKYTTNVIAQNFVMLDSKPADDTPQPDPEEQVRSPNQGIVAEQPEDLDDIPF